MVSPNLDLQPRRLRRDAEPVFDAQLGYMREMERIGVWMNGTLRDSAQFCTASTSLTLCRRPISPRADGYRGKLKELRKLAALLNCSPDDLVLVDNASNAINVLLARLGLIDDPFEPPTYAPVGPLKKPAVLLDLDGVRAVKGVLSGCAARAASRSSRRTTFPCTSADIVESVRATLAARARRARRRRRWRHLAITSVPRSTSP